MLYGFYRNYKRATFARNITVINFDKYQNVGGKWKMIDCIVGGKWSENIFVKITSLTFSYDLS